MYLSKYTVTECCGTQYSQKVLDSWC